jgi:flavin-dependent dehydrogenase
MKYDVAIIGGGLAGLALAIDLRKRGYSILVIEKGNYPRQKVCGEYISMESHDYLHRICPALSNITLPRMKRFKLSSTGSQGFETDLDLGGFGISRYLLEEMLYTEAISLGVVFMLKCKAFNIHFNEAEQTYLIKTNSGQVNSGLVCNSTGRNSNLESIENSSKLTDTNYIGIKYHLRLMRDPGFIEIHNFPGGYCGISSIEDGKSCLCYIVNAKMLKRAGNSIPKMEEVFLYQNGQLKKIFTTAKFLNKEPLVISGINFKIKETVRDGSLFLGDSAGSIAPVTGNGMSMALRSSAALAKEIHAYLSQETSMQQFIDNYGFFWKKEFSGRVKHSRHFQKLSEYPLLTNFSISLFKIFPSLAKGVIKLTHGKPF